MTHPYPLSSSPPIAASVSVYDRRAGKGIWERSAGRGGSRAAPCACEGGGGGGGGGDTRQSEGLLPIARKSWERVLRYFEF